MTDIAASSARQTEVARDETFCIRFRVEYMPSGRPDVDVETYGADPWFEATGRMTSQTRR